MSDLCYLRKPRLSCTFKTCTTASSNFFPRAPEDGFYMFTVVVRELDEDYCAGSVMRTLTTDPEDAVMLCRAEIGGDDNQTGTCTVRHS